MTPISTIIVCFATITDRAYALLASGKWISLVQLLWP